MRRVTWYFLLAEFLDIITTIVGITLGFQEMNPLFPHIGWGNLLLLKLFGVLVATIVLEKKKPAGYDIILPWIAVIPPLWNSFNLVLYLYFTII